MCPIELNVIILPDIPSPPTNLLAELTNDKTINITFEKPNHDTGCDITNYSISPIKNNIIQAKNNLSLGSSYYIHNNLEKNINYSYVMTTYNCMYESGKSITSNTIYFFVPILNCNSLVNTTYSNNLINIEWDRAEDLTQLGNLV